VETEYLDEEQVIALYNKVRTGKRTWPTGIWTSPAALQYAVTVFDYWIHNVMGWKGWPDARGKVTPALLEEFRSTLARSLMGTRLYVAGPESFIGLVMKIALEFNLNKDEIRAEECGTSARRVYSRWKREIPLLGRQGELLIVEPSTGAIRPGRKKDFPKVAPFSSEKGATISAVSP